MVHMAFEVSARALPDSCPKKKPPLNSAVVFLLAD
jgi:hypothetical protein